MTLCCAFNQVYWGIVILTFFTAFNQVYQYRNRPTLITAKVMCMRFAPSVSCVQQTITLTLRGKNLHLALKKLSGWFACVMFGLVTVQYGALLN